MNQADIIDAAFRAWGREGYRHMSLSGLAEELGVTKPALYRHFRDKESLLAAMDADFFDRYAAMLIAVSPSGFSDAAVDAEQLLRYVETIVAYFGRDRDGLAFLFGRVMQESEPERRFSAELAARGVPSLVGPADVAERRVLLSSAVSTAFFFVAHFHLVRGLSAPSASDAELRALGEAARGVCARGLGFAAGAADGLDYDALDRESRLAADETAASDGLLPAVAAVVAEVGAWKASMEMVAKRSGLSKSGLYAHFDSKAEMISRLFETEFDRIAACVEARCSRAETTAAKLYLASSTAAAYLLARPDVLVALDWVRTQRLDLRQLTPSRLESVFSFLAAGAESGELALIPGGLDLTVRWIMFLTIHQLMPFRDPSAPAGGPARRLRALHAFLLNGVEDA